MTRTVRREREQLRTWHPTKLGLVLTAGVLALSACSSNEPGPAGKDSAAPTPASSTASATPSTDLTATEKTAVLAAYSKFWDEQAKAYAQASLEGTELKKYAAGTALVRAQTDVASLKEKGVVATGRPTSNAVVTSIDPKQKVPRAALSDCLDIRDWKRVDAKTRKELPVPPERLNRYVTAVKAEKWGEQWKILEVTPEQRTC